MLDKLKKLLLYVILGLLVYSTDIKVHAASQLSPYEISSSKHSLIKIEDDIGSPINSIYLDASQVGGNSQMLIFPELMEISLKASSNTPAGLYSLPLSIETEEGESIQSEVEVQVMAEEVGQGRQWDEEIIYFLLTDRFSDGDSSNNNPFNLNYEGADNHGGVYHGGDFKGIADKIDYLDQLGITSIWISPIVLNVRHNVEAQSSNPEYYAYHGYWALDFTELNPHFGSIEDFHHLIDQAAERDINIIVDVVLNHVGYGLLPMDDGIESIEAFPTLEEQLVFAGMLRTEEGNDDLTTSLSGLPDLITEDPLVSQQIIDWQTSWIEWSRTAKGNQIDAYRVDTVNHVDKLTLQAFKNELVKLDPEFNLLGESWGASHKNAKGFLNSGMMDSVLDFGFKEIASDFINGQMERANDKLIERNQMLTSSALTSQFLSSHDEIGFLYKMNSQAKFMLAASLQLTAKGQPVIYYGEELGQSGPNNWPVYGNRYDFAWDEIENNPMYHHYQKLIDFRRQFSLLMARGDRETIAGSDEEGWLAIRRQYEDEIVYLLFNRNEEELEVTISVEPGVEYIDYYTSGNEINIQGNQINLTLPSIDQGGTALIADKNIQEVLYEAD